MSIYLKYLIIMDNFFIVNHLIQSQVFLFTFISQTFFPFHFILPYIIMYLVNSPKPLILLYLNRFLSDKKHIRILGRRYMG